MENTSDKLEAVARFEARREARAERYRELAEKNRERAEGRYKAFRSIADNIPMGQPILVGHHSERGHRADIKRMDSHMAKSIEHDKKARHYEQRAATIESNRAILSDDPAADDKLAAKLKKLEKQREAYKSINKLVRKHKTPDALEAALKAEFPDWKEHRHKAVELLTPDFAGRLGIPSYAISNLGAEIRRVKQRMETVEKVQSLSTEQVGFTFEGGRVEIAEGQWRVFFDSIPPEDLRKKLKCAPISLKWSRYQSAWVRKATGGTGQWFYESLKAALGVTQ